MATYQTTIICCVLLSVLHPSTALTIPPIIQRRLSHQKASHHRVESTTALRNDLKDEIERAAQRKAYEKRAQGGGTGELAAGVILGGILGGPFGALFGAQLGSQIGAAQTVNKARTEEMERKGLTPAMLEQATEIGQTLEQAVEGLRATKESVDTLTRLAKKLNEQSDSVYERAKTAMQSGEEDVARKLLLERERIKEKLLKTLKGLAEEKKRLSKMESNVEALETRALEIESLLRRSMGASSMKDAADMNMGLSLEREDPLLKKFRELGM